jgi:hypothetical protein
VVDSREAIPLRGSSLSQSSGLTSHVSQIHLNYEAMENQLRTTQDMLTTEQEDHKETRESLVAYNAWMQTFMVVRNKNTFVAFITSSDIKSMCANTFSIASHAPTYPGCVGFYHSHLATFTVEE